MAQLAIAIGGGAVGSVFGGVGAQIGFLAGSLIGAWLFAPKTTVEGPRLEDLRVTVSTYGKPIPIGFGTIRTGGNCIWSTDIQETKNKKKVGGKGGGGTTQITYTYSCSFAIAFVQREATDILRIWADSKLLLETRLDENGDPQLFFKKEGVTFRTYLGTETQDVDPLIEAEKGVGNTPAYRGIVYIVFEDLQLADYGNRLPSITAEIAFNGADLYPTTDVTPTNADTFFPNQDCLVKDPIRPWLWVMSNDKWALLDIVTGEEIDTGDLPAGNIGAFPCVGLDGSIFVQCGGTNAAPIYKIKNGSIVAGIGPAGGNPQWARHIGNLGYTQGMTLPQLSSINPNVVCCLPKLGKYVKFFNQDEIVDLDSLTVAELANVANPLALPELRYHGIILFAEIDGAENDTGLMLARDVNRTIWIVTDNKSLIKINVIEEASPFDYGPELTSTITYTAKRYDLSGDAIYSTDFICYDVDTHALIIGTAFASLSYDLTSVIQFDIETETITARYTSPDGIQGAPSTFSKGSFQAGPRDGRILLANGVYGTLLNAAQLSFGEQHEWVNWDGQDRRGYMYDSAVDSVYFANNTGLGSNQKVTRYWLHRLEGQPEQVKDAVEFMGDRVGLTATKRDTSELTDLLPGYLVAQQTSAKNAIAPLSSAFFFDAVESDWILKFVKAGHSGDFAVPNADLAAYTGGNRPPELTEIINQEIELPRQVYVKYLDIGTNYEPGEAVSPIRSDIVQTKRRQELNYPIALTASQAKEIAAGWLYRLWTGQTQLKYTLSQKWTLIDPTDVGTVTKDSTVFTSQVTTATFGDFVMDVTAVQEDAENYTQDIDADSGRDQDPPGIQNVGITTPLFFDTTIIRDIDADFYGTGIRAYGAVISYASGWKGAAYFKSIDGEDFEDVLFFSSGQEIEYGFLTTDLSASNFGTWDRFRFFRVKMLNGAPESAAEINVLNGANAALVGNPIDGWEIVQWSTVTDEGGGVYKIENLLRGRRGTNNFQNHIIGDYFIILSTDTIKRFSLDLDALNSTRYFVATSFGDIFNTNQAISATVNANALKPWSPSDVRAEWDSPSSDDITVTWERRTRYGGSWLDGTGSVPLNEASEEYEADIIDSSGDVVRTFNSLTSETFTYTSAQQTTDFGSTQDEIQVKLYQLSEFVGRGFVADVTLSKG